ncbi:calcium-binding protein [Mesobacterium pallidum]|uniref:calcium-binding protein n=1 Tax=Mesobacterium pallidum TaxID=2872037 RepID=UPI001EE1FB75|nr:calcium-binding protein [Mesobacterium pallidum]
MITSFGAGVSMASVGASLTNFGTIHSVSNDGVKWIGSTGVLINHGTIMASANSFSANAIEVNVDLAGVQPLQVINYGILSAVRIAFQGDIDDPNLLQNYGTIVGNVVGGEDADTVRNGGFLDGDVNLDLGDDLFIGRGGEVDGIVRGQDGNDTLNGGAGEDQFEGGVGEDVLAGRAGDDLLDGGDGDDSIAGGAGDDLLIAGVGRDTLLGGDGDDTLIAGTGGSDVLKGGRGNDVIDASGASAKDQIIGGAGNDTMTGGGGIDTFIFARGFGDDVITDFKNDIDLIDLSQLGIADYAKLIASGAVTGDAAQTVIDLSWVGIEGTITLEGFDRALISLADFII